MQHIYAGILPAEFRETNHGIKFWQEYEQMLLQEQIQNNSVKEEEINPTVLELVRLAGVSLTPPIDTVEPSAFEPETEVKSKIHKIVRFCFI